MDVNLSKSFGRVINTLRREMKLSQEELGYRAGLHRTYIGMIERGEKNITLENINKISIALNVSMVYVFSKLEEISS